jgi:hypothetical protein
MADSDTVAAEMMDKSTFASPCYPHNCNYDIVGSR